MTNLRTSTPMNNLGMIRGKEMNGKNRLIHTLFCKENDFQRR